jgi:calnexin
MQDVIEKGEKQPNLTIGVLVSISVVIVTVLFKILFGGKKPAVSHSHKKTVDTALIIQNL